MLVSSTHAVPQRLRPEPHVIAHELPTQEALPDPALGPGQSVPHAVPQFFGSLLDTHVAAHKCVPDGHTHAPPLHTSPPVQAEPQALQLFGSLVVSTQEPLQLAG